MCSIPLLEHIHVKDCLLFSSVVHFDEVVDITNTLDNFVGTVPLGCEL